MKIAWKLGNKAISARYCTGVAFCVPQAKVIKLESDQFSIDSDLLTPTYKLKRPTFRRMFSDSVSEMYGSLTISQVDAVRSE